MAAPSVTNSFVASTTISSSDMNQNFTDIVNGLSAGSTWDVVASTITTTGNATLGNAGADQVVAAGTLEVQDGGTAASSGSIRLRQAGKIAWNDVVSGNDVTLSHDSNGTFTLDATDATGGNTIFSIMGDAGDAQLRLMVNELGANTWDIINDNSDFDKLFFKYNSTTAFYSFTDGTFVAKSLRAEDDTNGVASTNTFTNAAPALGGGAAPTLGTIGGSGPTGAAQTGWIKIYVGTTAAFIPYWT